MAVGSNTSMQHAIVLMFQRLTASTVHLVITPCASFFDTATERGVGTAEGAMLSKKKYCHKLFCEKLPPVDYETPAYCSMHEA